MAKFYCPTKISGNISETPEGYLLCKGVAMARTGVMEYGPGETPLEVGEDGLVHVSREYAEVFNKKTMASFEGKAITIRHPDEFVNPDNWKQLAKGSIHNVREAAEKDEDGESVLEADLLITDSFAIGLVKNGLREVSCGYEAEYEQTGEGKGKQTGIVGNHLALVEQGRAGNSYAIKDHKGKGTMREKFLAALRLLSTGKTIDQALAEMEKGSKTKVTKIEKSKGVAKDESVSAGTSSKTKGEGTNAVLDEEQQKSYDAMKSARDALQSQMDAMKPDEKSEDESEEEEKSEDESEKEEKSEDESEEKEEKSKDAGADGEVLERLKACEAAILKLMEGKAADEKKDESEDAEEEEESEDGIEGGEKEEKKKTGDAARAEILCPGFEAPSKGDLKVAALKEAMKDEATAKLITSLNGGKKPTFDSAEKVVMLFNAASEIMKLRNGNGLAGTKAVDSQPITFESYDSTKEEMTPDKMNDMNAAHYNKAAK